MSVTKKKEDFLIYILSQKYNLDYKDKSFSQILDLIPSNIKLDGDLISLNNALVEYSDLTRDIIFCFINSDSSLLKSYKENQDIPNLKNLYETAFKDNKPFLKSFNTKSKIINTKSNTKPINTRFPPEPSGCLHIGHVKALLVNYNLAMKSKGDFLIRFDDTNPIKDYERYEKEILRDLDTLGIRDYKISHSSDYFDFLVEKALFLINKDLAYVDNTDQETMRRERFDGIESKCRNNTREYNLQIFNNMLSHTNDDSKDDNSLSHSKDNTLINASNYCLRAKINMSDPNKTMRDPVIYRCSDKPHCRNDKYKAYPTYDFVCPILDSIEGITVACRADEYKDRNAQYKWFLNALELDNKPDLKDFSKLNLENTVLSKRKIDKLILDKEVTNWDDPRLSTVQGIRRLGMNMEALKEYINLQGASTKTNIISWDKIWSINKKVIDPLSPRFMAIEKENSIRVRIITNCIDRCDTINNDNTINTISNNNNNDIKCIKKCLLHKKNPDLGTKDVLYDDIILISHEDALLLKNNEEFTLMNWGNAIVKDNKLDNFTIELNLEGDYKSTVNKISWISELGSVLVKGVEYGNVLDKDNMKEVLYLAESSIVQVKEGMHVQFERIGFFYCDSPFVFHLVPYTKQKRNK